MMQDSNRVGRRGVAGFTLLEVLVALALMSLVTSLLSGGLSFGRRTWDVSAARDERQSEEAGRDAIRDLMRRALPVRRMADRAEIRFLGRGDAVAFVALADPEVEAGGLRTVRLRVRQAGDRSDLVAETFAEGANLDLPGEAGSSTVLIRGAAAIAIRYLDDEPSVGSRPWLSEWRGRSALPAMVEIRVSFERAQRVYTVLAPLLE